MGGKKEREDRESVGGGDHVGVMVCVNGKRKKCVEIKRKNKE